MELRIDRDCGPIRLGSLGKFQLTVTDAAQIVVTGGIVRRTSNR